MMTPQEVASCTFSKAVMGGYNMAAVDDFLDKLTEDYTALYNDNAALKAKMKVLVERLEEYKGLEDTMRSTLLTAQKLANNLVAEAEAKRDELIADAAGAAQKRLAEIQSEVAAEEARLIRVRADVEAQITAEQNRLTTGQSELRRYIQTVESVCRQQLELLEKLPELPAAPAAPVAPVVPAAPAAAEAPAAPVAEEPAAEPAPVVEEPAAAVEPVADETIAKDIENVFAAFAKAEEAEQVEESAGADVDPFDSDPFADDADMDMASTRKINLDELQFGRNYKKD